MRLEEPDDLELDPKPDPDDLEGELDLYELDELELEELLPNPPLPLGVELEFELNDFWEEDALEKFDTLLEATLDVLFAFGEEIVWVGRDTVYVLVVVTVLIVGLEL